MKLDLRFSSYLAICLLMSACAGERLHQAGMAAMANGQPDQGLSSLEQAVKSDPDNVLFRADLLNSREAQVNRWLASADTERASAHWDAAAALYLRVLQIEPTNAKANAGLAAIERAKRNAAAIASAQDSVKNGEWERAAGLIKPVLDDNPAQADALALKRQIDEQRAQTVEPTLSAKQRRPINLEFRDANLKIVLEALARSTGVNFILDKDVRPDLRTTVFLHDARLEDAVELILQTNHLEKKVLNSKTILIYANTPEKLKEYQELVMKGFYLSNADVKQVQAMIKAMLKTKDTFIDEKLNLLYIRDTPEAIRLAEKLIAMQDLSEPEVMMDVQLLEVQRNKLADLGVQWPGQLTVTPIPASASQPRLSDLSNLNSSRLGTPMPSVTFNASDVLGNVNVLANPRIRARNREKAQVMIGDKVPVSSSTVTATGIISENIQYLDVGIKLEVEPNIYLHDEVAIKMGLEVSSITNQVTTPAGSTAYQIGTRNASTVLRLKDGETQILAGLIGDQDRFAANQVPGLGNLPLLGHLFASQSDNRQKTEIVLAITPHLIRSINRPELAASEFWSGTETSLRTKPLALQESPVAPDNAGGQASESNAQGGPTSPDSPNAKEAKGNVAPTQISLSWKGPDKVKVGDQFKLALRMKADGGMRSLPFQLRYDPKVIQVLDVTEGGYFKQNDTKTSLSSNVDAAGGKIFVSVVRAGVEGARGEDDVAVLSLRALAPAAQSQITLLSSSPVSVGDKTVTPAIPAPFSVTVSN